MRVTGTVKEEFDENESDLDVDEPRTERAVSPEVQNREMKFNHEGEDELHGAHGNGSRSKSRRKRKSAWGLEKQF